MIQLFKDSYRLSILIATIFFVSILVSAYVLYTLPHNLEVNGGAHSAFTETYIIVAISFLLGSVAVYFGLKSSREIVVYKDRTMDNDALDKNGFVDENKTTITLDGVKAGLQQASTEKDTLQIGLQVICKQVEAGQGAIYLTPKDGSRKLELKSGYALGISETASISFDFGEGLVGQCAANGRTLYVDDVPDGYIKIISGLGSSSPRYLLIVPIKKDEKVIGVMEIASFSGISEDQRKFVEESAQLLAEKVSDK